MLMSLSAEMASESPKKSVTFPVFALSGVVGQLQRLKIGVGLVVSAAEVGATPEGAPVGATVGTSVGDVDGRAVGVLGEVVATNEGDIDGIDVGVLDGAADGSAVGSALGRPLGVAVGLAVGKSDGLAVGMMVGDGEMQVLHSRGQMAPISLHLATPSTAHCGESIRPLHVLGDGAPVGVAVGS